MDLPLGVLLLAGLAVLAGAAVQGSIGLGLGLVGAPALALLDASLVPATILLVTSVLPVLTSLRELQDVDWRGLGFALTGRFPGVLVGSWVVVTQPARTTAIVVAVVVLGAVALSLTSWHARPTPRALLTAGLVSGVSGTATSIGGPPVALLYQHESGARLRSTMGLYFLAGNVLSGTVLALAGQIGVRDLARAGALLPFVLVGFLLSGPLRGRVDGGTLRTCVLVVSAAGAVVLLVRTLVAG
ncbi:MAG TPA: sulfite exporter TauE/SafE family protein [Actinomycetales bacterium]